MGITVVERKIEDIAYAYAILFGRGEGRGQTSSDSSYLSDRTHFVSIRGARSVTRSLSCGVPQGSVLDRFYICSIPPHWGILSDNTTWAIISMLMILSCICPSILSVGMIKLILSLRLNLVLEISTVGCLVTNLSCIGTRRNCSLSYQFKISPTSIFR